MSPSGRYRSFVFLRMTSKQIRAALGVDAPMRYRSCVVFQKNTARQMLVVLKLNVLFDKGVEHVFVCIFYR